MYSVFEEENENAATQHIFYLSISRIAQLLLSQVHKFYCFCTGSHISSKYVQYNHICCLMMGQVFLKHNLITLTCSWHDKLFAVYRAVVMSFYNMVENILLFTY